MQPAKIAFGLLLVGLSACVPEGRETPAGARIGPGEGPGDQPPVEEKPPTEEVPIGELDPCVEDEFEGVTLEALVEKYSTEVHPLLLSETDGCLACHHSQSQRPLTIDFDAAATFHRIRAGGFLTEGAGSIVARLTNPDPAARMPRGLPAWKQEQVQVVADLGCAVKEFESQAGVVPADEQFPVELTQPYAGPPHDDYENRFIDYGLLKNKIAAVFQDNWVRDSVDLFAENIGLLGGVDFVDHFLPARGATPEFLLALDDLARDVCETAAIAGTGPFVDFDFTAALDTSSPVAREQVALLYERVLFHRPSATERLEATELLRDLTAYGDAAEQAWGGLCEALVRHPDFLFVKPPALDQPVQVGVEARQHHIEAETLVGTRGAATANGWNLNSNGYVEAPFYAAAPGEYRLSVRAYARQGGPDLARMTVRLNSVDVQTFDVAGEAANPETFTLNIEVETGTHAVAAAFINDFYDAATMSDRNLYVDWLEAEGPLDAGGLTAQERIKLETVRLAQATVRRPPTPEELETALLPETTYETMADFYLGLPELRDRYFEYLRIRTESAGTPASDEPARLWTWIMSNGRPFQEVLTADYTVDEAWNQVSRPEYHGKSGVLTMKGFIETKQGLPHYNYAARVMTDFMDVIFEIPPEVFEQRATSTPASTVDPTSICYSCHQVLTPLSHQRLKWDDAGNYRETDEAGTAIDDSDRSLVPTYKFKGSGMPAFAAQAVRKEAFVRRMLNAQYEYLLGRGMRWSEDERTVYQELWDLSVASEGDLRAVLRAIVLSPAFRGGESS